MGDLTVNENIKSIREKAHKSQQAVADYLGITRQAYSHYEVGRRKPDCETLRKLGRYFGVSTDYLLGEERGADIVLKIRGLRQNCGITMKELGSEIGVAESTISQYETGKRQPDYETLIDIADFFGVSVDYLLGREQDGIATGKSFRNNIAVIERRKDMKKSEYIPEEQLDEEIARLRQSPDVRLAEKYKRLKYRKRIYLSELKCLEKNGKELRAKGITEENLYREYEAIDDE